jgi:hypothetical protein
VRREEKRGEERRRGEKRGEQVRRGAGTVQYRLDSHPSILIALYLKVLHAQVQLVLRLE